MHPHNQPKAHTWQIKRQGTGRQVVVNVLHNFSSNHRHNQRDTGFLTCKDWMLAFKTVTKKHVEILFVPFQFGRSMRLQGTPLPGRSCAVSRTLSVNTHAVSGLFPVSSLAARYVLWTFERELQRPRAYSDRVFALSGHHGALARDLGCAPRGQENPNQWQLRTQTIAGLFCTRRGAESEHCPKCSRPSGCQRQPLTGGIWARRRAWTALYLFGDYTAMGILCIFRNGEWGDERKAGT